MPAVCTRCSIFTIKAQSHEHRKAGLYRCPKGPLWVFHSPTKPHECARFTPVAEADLPARIQFEQSQQGDK